MQLSLIENLPFTEVEVTYNKRSIVISDVLVDTGSGTTILAADFVSSISIAPDQEDILYTIRGVGGSEVVFARRIDCLRVGECGLDNF